MFSDVHGVSSVGKTLLHSVTGDQPNVKCFSTHLYCVPSAPNVFSRLKKEKKCRNANTLF